MVTRYNPNRSTDDYYTLPPGLDAKQEAPAVYKCPRSLSAPRNFHWPAEIAPEINALRSEASEVAKALAKLASSAHVHRSQPAYPDGEPMLMVHQVIHQVYRKAD